MLTLHYPNVNLTEYFKLQLFVRDYGRVSFDDFGVVLRFQNNHDTRMADIFLTFTKKD